MPKNIVFCADGSWSHPNEAQDGTYRYPDKKPVNIDKQLNRPDLRDIDVSGTTNVFKFYDALIPGDSSQVVFYDKGVGTTGGVIDHIIGGAFGEGLFEKIKDGYSNIANTYQEGDAIHLFGFSRGAYTVRCLAGMIAECGIPAPGIPVEKGMQALEDTFTAYRERDPVHKKELIDALKENYGNRPARIAEIGVWDTVGAMGIPGEIFQLGYRRHYGFLDARLHPDVEAAWHAIAVDEKRSAFGVTPFEGPFAPGQQVDQVWFAGTHGDVGGGTKDPALSDIPLGWMMKKAMSKGLAFDPIKLAKYADLPEERALDPIHESWKETWNPAWGLPVRRSIPGDAVISDSVVARIQDDPGYRPHKLKPSKAERATGSLIPGSMHIEKILALQPAQAIGLS